MAEKEVLSVEDIKKNLKDIDSKKELSDSDKLEGKKKFLKELIADENYKDKKKELVKELTPLILKKPIANYNLIYDSLSEGLEPIYFWTLDTMRDSPPAGIGLEVWKGTEEFEASVTSGYFGEIGQRSTLMQQKAMEYLGTINNIIKSVLNLIYDLKEFEIKLKPYDELKDSSLSEEKKRSALYALKGIWMDQVDSRKGRGSINMLVQDLQFVTLRDAFFYIEKPEDIESKKVDLNDRVKRILKIKLEEFNIWKEYSEKEIRKRYEIEKTYLKSQYGTIKLYTSWLKPYLIAAQKLKMRNMSGKGLINPNIINAFSNMEIEIKLYGRKEIKPEDVHQSFRDIIIDTKYYAITEIIMKFRSVPSALSGQGGRQYIHSGRTDLIFNGYAVDNIELEAIEAMELYEDLDLIESFINISLEQLEKEIIEYTKEPVKEESVKKPKSKTVIENPFKGLFEGFLEIYKPISETFVKKKKGHEIVYEELASITKKKTESQTYLMYNLYKRTHGMLNV
ncbi:hypothetical protein HYU23_03940 [Candidatus Woesearchaeota archaeon]|nr:hypothetical protein [Candidatus Woesearchaeota archaeon]